MTTLHLLTLVLNGKSQSCAIVVGLHRITFFLLSTDLKLQVTNLRARGLQFLYVPDKYYINLKERLKTSSVNVNEDIDMVRDQYNL